MVLTMARAWLLCVVLCAAMVDARDNCDDPAAFNTCLRPVADLQYVVIVADSGALSSACSNMSRTLSCTDAFLEDCVHGQVAVDELRAVLRGIRNTSTHLCTNGLFQTEMTSKQECFQYLAGSQVIEDCNTAFLKRAKGLPADMCKARLQYLECVSSMGPGESPCDRPAFTSACLMADLMANFVVPRSMCAGVSSEEVCSGAAALPVGVAVTLTMAALVGVMGLRGV